MLGESGQFHEKIAQGQNSSFLPKGSIKSKNCQILEKVAEIPKVHILAKGSMSGDGVYFHEKVAQEQNSSLLVKGSRMLKFVKLEKR